MRHQGYIAVSEIEVDRLPVGKRTLSLANHLASGAPVPPIHVEPIGNGRFRILDGRHRTLAHRLVERPKILARWGTR